MPIQARLGMVDGSVFSKFYWFLVRGPGKGRRNHMQVGEVPLWWGPQRPEVSGGGGEFNFFFTG